MNETLASQLNAHLDPDTGLLDMPRVIDTIEQHYDISILTAVYVGGSTEADEARDLYYQAYTWNAGIRANQNTRKHQGLLPFALALAWILSPLMVAVTLGL